MSSTEVPNRCPACGGPRVVRIYSGYKMIGTPLMDRFSRPWREGIDGVQALLGGMEELPEAAAWTCLDCYPGWLEVHGLALEEEEFQEALERSLVSPDFEQAAMSRDRRNAASKRIRERIAELLV